MECKKYQKLISDYYSGTISEKDANKIKHHLEKCSKCREVLEFYKILDEEIRDVSTVELSSEYWNHYWPRIRENIEEISAIKHAFPLRRINWKWSVVGVAAVVLLAIITTVFFPGRGIKKGEDYSPFTDHYFLSFIHELEEDNYLAESFGEIVSSEMGKEIEEIYYFDYSKDLDVYNLLNEMDDEERQIFYSEIIKEVKNKEVKNEIQS